MKNKIIVLLIALVCIFTFTACNNRQERQEGEKGEGEKEETMILNTEWEVMCVNDAVKLFAIIEPKSDGGESLIWKSKNELVAKVDKSGLVTATGSGETEIIVTTEDNKIFRTCKITVGEILISQSFDESVSGYGTNKFSVIADGVEKAKPKDTIVIYEGEYNESVIINKTLSLVGINNPSLKGLKFEGEGNILSLENINFLVDEYPESDSGILEIESGADLKMTSCYFEVDSIDEARGGYAILAKGKRKTFSVTYCGFENFRYGILLQNSGGLINIDGCKLKKMSYGIGVNLKSSDGRGTNPAEGLIYNNEYSEVGRKCEFVFTGSNYEGGLKFEDFNKDN